MKNIYVKRFILVVATGLLWQAGGGIRPSLIGQAHAQPVQASGPVFPDVSSAFWKDGAFPSIEALRTMGTGMSKDQVRLLLGHPHFNEGLGGAREWNYLFHLRTGRDTAYVTCQYLVRFDERVLTSGMFWKGQDCAALVQPPAPAPVAVVPAVTVPAVVPPAQAPQRFTLSTDGLFAFNRAGAQDLLPAGRARVLQLATEVKGQRDIRAVRVVGHTDRIGSEAYNRHLSQARAQTVRELLVRQGVADALISSEGVGESQPVSDCRGSMSHTALVACLQPDRRVEIEVTGDK